MLEPSLIHNLVTQIWFQFVQVALFGFLTGLELRGYLDQRCREDPKRKCISFGTSRTYTFIAIIGYVFTVLDPAMKVYLAGFAGLLIFFALFFHNKLHQKQPGILQPLIGLIVYGYGPAAVLEPPWFLVLLFVSVVFTLNARPLAHRITAKIDSQEMLILAKFLLISGVILPLLPEKAVSSYIPASPFKIGVAVIVISSISYIGYILKKYFLKRQGYLVIGLLGGLYSSTATTVVLAKKTRRLITSNAPINAGLIAASGMMYLRLLLLVAFLKLSLLKLSLLPFLFLGLITLVVAWMVQKKEIVSPAKASDDGALNPLELGAALLFAGLFVIMMVVTRQVVLHFGKSGLDLLSFVIGFTDIDPFVLSLLGGHYPNVNMQQLTGAILIAAGSNNILKAGYTGIFGKRRVVKGVIFYLLLLGLVSLVWGIFLSRGIFI